MTSSKTSSDQSPDFPTKRLSVDEPVDLMACTNIPNLSQNSVDKTHCRPKQTQSTLSPVDFGRNPKDLRDFQTSSTRDVLQIDEFAKVFFDENAVDEKLDPHKTFTSLMDFNFMSQVRQPWKRCRDAVDINYIV
jgi:hypothetical protein